MNFRLHMTLVLSLVTLGCDSGSVGEFESDDGSGTSGAGSTSDTSATTASSQSSTSGSATDSATSGSSASATATATSDGTSTETGGESSSTTGGPVGACEASENHLCAEPVDCGDACGELDSMFDDNGCVRQACMWHDECGSGEFCYRPLDYGGCQSSDVGCTEDTDGNCFCGSLPDCGGAYCVPEELVFGGASEGPTTGWASDECAPNDGPAFVLRVGTYASDACGGQFAEEPLIEFLVAQPLGTMGTWVGDDLELFGATYYPDGVNPEPLQYAVLYLNGSMGGFLTGQYEVTLADDTVLYGEYEAISCTADPPPMCG